MKKYTIQYKAGANKIGVDSFEQYLPMVFKLVIEQDTDTNAERIYTTSVEYIGKPCWSEQKAISLALTELLKIKDKK